MFPKHSRDFWVTDRDRGMGRPRPQSQQNVRNMIDLQFYSIHLIPNSPDFLIPTGIYFHDLFDSSLSRNHPIPLFNFIKSGNSSQHPLNTMRSSYLVDSQFCEFQGSPHSRQVQTPNPHKTCRFLTSCVISSVLKSRLPLSKPYVS